MRPSQGQGQGALVANARKAGRWNGLMRADSTRLGQFRGEGDDRGLFRLLLRPTAGTAGRYVGEVGSMDRLLDPILMPTNLPTSYV